MNHVLHLDFVRERAIDHAVFAHDDFSNVVPFEFGNDAADLG